MDHEREVLVVKGRLDRAGRFVPGRSRSTPNVRSWPVVEAGDTVIELLDGEGHVLHREPADVRPDIDCAPGDAQSFSVTAYIELRGDAVEVQLRRGDMILWRDKVGEPATLELKAGRRRKEGAVQLRLRFSQPREDASLLVVYQWGQGQFEPVYLGPPTELLDIDLSPLPGGSECRLVATYSDGLRSAAAATDAFAVPRKGPSVAIVQPRPGQRFEVGASVILEGGVIDRERKGGPRYDEDVIWSVDEVEVGTGLITSVDGLAVGRHVVTVHYVADPGATTSVEIAVRRSKDTPAEAWPEWNPLVE